MEMFMIYSVNKGISVFAALFFLEGLCWGRIVNVKELGAGGNKQGNDGPAIQAGIDECYKQGGGTVYVPAGDYFCGGLRMKSNVSLFLEAGATLWVSGKKEDYKNGNRFLYAENEKNITIEGRGTIYGTGEEPLMRKKTDQKEQMPTFRVGILRFERCRNVAINDITVRYSDSWTFDFEFCENVFINGVSILNNYYRVNADGIDPVSCKGVHISNCHIIAGDDCIVFKTREGRACEDAVVTNCTLESVATAIKIGTESQSDFRNIRVSNCVIRNSTVGIGIYIKDGGTAEQISFSNCSIETIRDINAITDSLKNAVYPIFVDIEKRQNESRVGRIRDLTFTDIDIVSDNGILIQGMGKSKIDNLTMRNITVRVDRGFDYSKRKKHTGGKTSETEDRRVTIYAQKPSYITLANIDGLSVDGLRVFVPEDVFSKYNRSALSLYEVDSGAIGDVLRRPDGTGSQMPVVVAENCRNTSLPK
jgi:polygalacturonase